ncbi:NACHT domain-containing protein [Actinoplanes sp. CA-030573]|uniref:NACHT domain-containing protein n=1 Tax=Actinoplanes sp. CA-030573 TaxID=3239898 RepID=UPI003D907990
MAYVSSLARQIESLLVAQGWQCRANRFTLAVTEPAVLTPTSHTWMAGDAPAMTDGDIRSVRPNLVIVSDHASELDVERIKACMGGVGREPQVERLTSFVDRLWDAPQAAVRARLDAQMQDQLFESLIPKGLPEPPTPDSRHAPQQVWLGGTKVLDHRLLEKALPAPGSWLAVLADAGQGKSELLQWHEWRYAVFYESARAQKVRTLPPVALRVPLRSLHALSLDAIAHYLSRPDPDNGLPAVRNIGSGECLRQLLRIGRVILLLDGLDELLISREKIAEGLAELYKVKLDGGQMVVSTRVGHLTSRTALADAFDERDIARIVEMTQKDAHKLLTKYNASDEKADAILKRLAASPTQRIPLFLLMAYAVDLSTELDPHVRQSRTRVLAELLRLFCQRDEPRLEVSTDDQMQLLTDLAHWMFLDGEPTPDKALELLGIDQSEPRAAIILNPHALLTRAAGRSVSFKYPQFQAFFTARALAGDWSHYGFESIAPELRTRKLDEATVEFLARLVEDSDLLRAWVSTENEPKLVRRNLLALALARLDDDVPGESPAVRSRKLAALLGSSRLEDVSMVDLSLVRLDFTGWTLARIQGRGGSMQYCVNLDRSQYDDSILTLDDHEGTDLPARVDEQVLLASGADRLNRLIRPLLRRGSNTFIPMQNLAEAKDNDGWKLIRRAGLASQERRGTGGEHCWLVNDDGVDLINAFITAEATSPAALQQLIRDRRALRKLLLALAA